MGKEKAKVNGISVASLRLYMYLSDLRWYNHEGKAFFLDYILLF